MSDPENESTDALAQGEQIAEAAASAAAPATPGHGGGNARTAALTLGALGVVFGDIGTSPLYALRETVLATGGATPGPAAVFGALSLIFWSVMIVVTIKYVLLIMRADNEGEGGSLALAALAHRSPGLSRRTKSIIGIAAIVGLSLFYGDGMLTPAISVLSAVEGVGIGSPLLEPLILPLSLIILVGLFVLQSRGTAKIGRLFGPVMALWFTVLAVLGIIWIVQAPVILKAFNPFYAIDLFIREPLTAFLALGAVVLAVTGCEALYADMGHFGAKPIRLAWFFARHSGIDAQLFRPGRDAAAVSATRLDGVLFAGTRMGPFPVGALATVAAIIASQAVISGVFSITRQAVQLGQLPRMEVRHTSATDYGQIYVPRMNAFLLLGVVLIVLIFRSSSNLASAYGIAVTGVMVIDTFNVSLVAAKQWKWGWWLAGAAFGALGFVDIMFFASNSIKIVEGGWLPIFIATCVFLLMETWRIGRRAHLERIRNESLPIDLFLERAEKTPVRVAGTAVFLSARSDSVPGALLHNLKHNKVLHERVLLVHVDRRGHALRRARQAHRSREARQGLLQREDPSRLLRNAGRPAFARRGPPLSGWRSTSRPRRSSSAMKRWCHRSIPHSGHGAPGSICGWPPRRCHRPASITCRPAGWSSWARRSRSSRPT